jgi:hypothetical protein
VKGHVILKGSDTGINDLARPGQHPQLECAFCETIKKRNGWWKQKKEHELRCEGLFRACDETPQCPFSFLPVMCQTYGLWMIHSKKGKS